MNLKIFIALLGTLIIKVTCLGNSKYEEKLIFSPLYKGAEKLMLSQHPIAATTRLVLYMKALDFALKDIDMTSGGFDDEDVFNPEIKKKLDNDRRRGNLISLATHLGVRYVGNQVEDYFHEQGYDITQAITHQFDSYPVIRDNIVKPGLETTIFIGKEITYAGMTAIISMKIQSKLS